jgi:hypothetical protein
MRIYHAYLSVILGRQIGGKGRTGGTERCIESLIQLLFEPRQNVRIRIQGHDGRRVTQALRDGLDRCTLLGHESGARMPEIVNPEWLKTRLPNPTEKHSRSEVA